MSDSVPAEVPRPQKGWAFGKDRLEALKDTCVPAKPGSSRATGYEAWRVGISMVTSGHPGWTT